MSEHLTRYDRGAKFTFPLLVLPYGRTPRFADQPVCPVYYQSVKDACDAWMARPLEDRRANIQEAPGKNPLSIARAGYRPDCECEVCRDAYLATYMKGLLGPGSAQYAIDPRFTRDSFQKAKDSLAQSYTATMADPKLAPQAASVIRAEPGALVPVQLPRSKFLGVFYAKVRGLYNTQEGPGHFYPRSPKEGCNHPQPTWALLSSMDEVFALAEDMELLDMVRGYSLLGLIVGTTPTGPQTARIIQILIDLTARGVSVIVTTGDVAFLQALKGAAEFNA